MTAQTAMTLANVVLSLHILAALFIIFGLIVIPLGARRWGWIRVFWWRLLHVITFAIVVVQKLWGETCFLTVWENRLLAIARQAPREVPLIHAWGDKVIHVPLPMTFVVVLYTGLWLWTIWLWFAVPPRPSKQRARHT